MRRCPTCRGTDIHESFWGDTTFCLCRACGQRFEFERKPVIRFGFELWKLRRRMQEP